MQKNKKATSAIMMMMMFKLKLPYRVRQHGSKASWNLSPAGRMNRVLKQAERKRKLAHVCRATLLKSQATGRQGQLPSAISFYRQHARLRPHAQARAWP